MSAGAFNNDFNNDFDNAPYIPPESGGVGRKVNTKVAYEIPYAVTDKKDDDK